MEKPPLITALLPVRSLGGPDANSLPANVLPVGFEDYEEKNNGKRPLFWS
jgi:hypothetical protein